uniref:Uncharacterized protein n=1 Tax=Wildemania schizophylla TaxID=1134705 RepID=A0A126G1W5_WILSC|nr:hypothetical protein [Wildemania schizophylla]AKS28479.1 hypothetical protein [Wildemania schizophylla]
MRSTLIIKNADLSLKLKNCSINMDFTQIGTSITDNISSFKII